MHINIPCICSSPIALARDGFDFGLRAPIAISSFGQAGRRPCCRPSRDRSTDVHPLEVPDRSRPDLTERHTTIGAIHRPFPGANAPRAGDRLKHVAMLTQDARADTHAITNVRFSGSTEFVARFNRRSGAAVAINSDLLLNRRPRNLIDIRLRIDRVGRGHNS
jgi:hypothetical protein